MKIRGTESELAILKELGARTKQHRIDLNMTQEDFAERCGLSVSTLVRIEMGTDAKMSNYIKILSALNISENIDLLLPEKQPDYKLIFDKNNVRQRVKSSHKGTHKKWTWEEDK